MQRRHVLAAGALAVLTGPAGAAGWPAAPIKLIYNFAPGGPGDAVARHLAEQLTPRLGQQVVVDNRTGASGTIGILAAARAPADGYTLLFTSLPGVVQMPWSSAEKNFDPVRALQPIAVVGTAPLVILAHPSVPAQDFPGFLAWARAQNAPVPVAGAGAIIELSLAWLSRETKLELQFIPYRGSAPAVQAVLSGEVKAYLMPPSGMTTELVKAGKLKVIAVGSDGPSALVPGALPINRQVPGFVQEIDFCLWGPPGLPAEVMTRLGAELKEVMAQPGTTAAMLAQSMEPRTGGPAEVTQLIVRSSESIRRILATTPIKFGQ